MLKFVVDEDLPRSTSRMLAVRGFEVWDVRDCGLRGKSDLAVFEFAQDREAVIVSGDLGFGNILQFPAGTHQGIIVIHFPDTISNEELNRQFSLLLDNLAEEEISGNLLMLEPGKIRVRRR